MSSKENQRDDQKGMSDETAGICVYPKLIAHWCNRPRAVVWCEAWETSSDGTVYHARFQCHYPDDPVAVEFCKGMAEKRAKHLAVSRSVKYEDGGV